MCIYICMHMYVHMYMYMYTYGVATRFEWCAAAFITSIHSKKCSICDIFCRVIFGLSRRRRCVCILF